jgi:hypothetical protein
MNDCKKFSDIIRPLLIRTSMKYLLATISDHASVFKITGRTIAGRIHTNGGKFGLGACRFPFAVCRRLAFIFIILAEECSFRLLA